jgi:predicted nucleotidyltransferase
MLPNRNAIERMAAQRVAAVGASAQSYFDEASEIVVFGSMSAGLDGPGSDIDILCFGLHAYKIKTNLVDLIVLPRQLAKTPAWLQSELATHIAEYGTPLKGDSKWINFARVGQSAIDIKSRRVATFLRSLPHAWPKLIEAFRVKYAVKLRRETQRLLLLERRTPVPPTKILDNSWEIISKSRYEIEDRLVRMSIDRQSVFIRDLLGRIEAHFDTNCMLASLTRPCDPIH